MRIVTAQQNVIKAFKNDPDLTVLTNTPCMKVVITSNTVDCAAMCKLMREKFNWICHNGQYPNCLAFSFGDGQCDNWEDFVKSVRECVKMMKANPKLNKTADTELF